MRAPIYPVWYIFRKKKMFSDKLKILLLTLLFALNHPVSIYASDDEANETSTNVSKKRPRATAPQNNPPLTDALPVTSSFPKNSDEEAAGKPAPKASKRDENAKSTGVASTSGASSFQSSTSLLQLATAPSENASSSPDAPLSAPQPLRNYTSSPIAAPSAAPSIKPPAEEEEPEEAKKKFTESRVKTNRFAYFYGEQYFDFTEWETETAWILKRVTDKIHTTIPTINVALAQLSLIYEIGPEIHKIDFMLPYFFMSRWPDDREKSIIEKAFQTAKIGLTPQESTYAAYKSFHVGNGEGFTWKGFFSEFKAHLRNIISLPEDNKSSLIESRITTRNQQINQPNGKDFSSDYSHSEQAILIYLLQKSDEYLSKILSQLSKQATITTFLLNISSFNDMCEKCGDTFFRATERKSITSIWEPLIKKEGYTISPEGIRFFVACAGLHKYPRLSSDGKSLVALRDKQDQAICSVSLNGKDGIDLLNYQHPTVALHYLPEEGV